MNALIKVVAVVSLAGSLGACTGMSHTDRDTAVGAGIGAVGGAALTGSPWGALGGAAVGGIVGHEVGEHHDRRRDYRD